MSLFLCVILVRTDFTANIRVRSNIVPARSNRAMVQLQQKQSWEKNRTVQRRGSLTSHRRSGVEGRMVQEIEAAR